MSVDALALDFGEWDIESFRLSIFFPPMGRTLSGLWEQLMGIAAESEANRPREGIRQEQGPAEGNRLLLDIRDERLDWQIVGPQPLRGEESRSPVIKLNAGERMIPLLARALDVSLRPLNQVHRIAFGSVLVWQASDLNEGMRQLSKFLPQMDLESRGGSDFIYQINRRLRSTLAPHVTINRISRWQTEEIQGGMLRVTPTQPRFEISERVLINKLTLDVNTAPEGNAISPERMPALFRELANLAHDTAIKGDVP